MTIPFQDDVNFFSSQETPDEDQFTFVALEHEPFPLIIWKQIHPNCSSLFSYLAQFPSFDGIMRRFWLYESSLPRVWREGAHCMTFHRPILQITPHHEIFYAFDWIPSTNFLPKNKLSRSFCSSRLKN